MNWPATIANSLWTAASLPDWARFRRALHRPEETQRSLLRGLLSLNADCDYGRAYGFGGITSYEEFARRVPLVDYDALEPWVERIRGGESGLLTSEPVTHLIPTSGSTGSRKLIPFTGGLQKQFDRAIGPWIADLVRQDSRILFGPAYWSITPSVRQEEKAPSVVPVGFVDDASYLGGVKGWLVRAAMAVPSGIAKIGDLEKFRHETLLGLLRHRDLRMISVWHPSFLTLLLDDLPRHWEKILAQIHSESRRRERELQRIDPRQPQSLWPHLRTISCWADGNAALFLTDLRRRFPDVHVQAKGLLATEAVVTLPFGGLHPVAIQSHFFEFIDGHGQAHLAHELDDGEEYEVAVTTAGGLWRYRLHDRIRVTGFLGSTPSLRFIGRSGNVTDLFGEKLSESFVAEVLRQCLIEVGVRPRFALIAPDEDAMGWRYTLYLEGEAPDSLAESLDRLLGKNPHYAYCRELGQLLPSRTFAIKQGGYEIFCRRQVAEGKRLGEIKPTLLCRASGWSQIFPGAYIGKPDDKAVAFRS